MKKIKSITNLDLQNLANVTDLADVKRQLRKPLLSAFDIYKSNIYYGIITETSEEHAEIMAWYQDLCDLSESALANVPIKIKKYIGG